jgi:hypothetical protein
MLNPTTNAYDRIADLTTSTFTVIRQPLITVMDPQSGKEGETITVTGDNFDSSDPLNNVVMFAAPAESEDSSTEDHVQAAVESVSDDGTKMNVIVPPNAVTGYFTVSVNNLAAASPTPFTVIPRVSVTVAPDDQDVILGQTASFAATVTGLHADEDPSVVWSVNGIPHGNETYGTIDSDGTYHAPPAIPVSSLISISAESASVPAASSGHASVVLKPNFVPSPGDVNEDSEVTIADAMLALQDYLGLVLLSDDQIRIGDVRPKPGAHDRPYGDGQIKADDLNWILQRAIGLETDP